MSEKNVIIDGVEYAPVGPTGNRAVVVVDRGWIFAGDVNWKEGAEGRIFLVLKRAIWVFNWQSIGFDGVLADPKSTKVNIRRVPGGEVEIPAGSEIFRVPVGADWGL